MIHKFPLFSCTVILSVLMLSSYTQANIRIKTPWGTATQTKEQKPIKKYYSKQEFSLANVDPSLFNSKNYTKNQVNTLNSKDKTYLLHALQSLIKIIAKQSSLEKEHINLGVYTPYWPKTPNRPMFLFQFSMGDALTIFLHRIEGAQICSSSYIVLGKSSNNPDHSLDLVANFIEQDFTKTLNLNFEKMEIENDVTSYQQSKSGHSISVSKERYYTYHYQWNNDDKVKVTFTILPTHYNSKEAFPRSFSQVKIFVKEKY